MHDTAHAGHTQTLNYRHSLMLCRICNTTLQTLYTDLFDDRYGYPERYAILQCNGCGTLHTSPAFPEEHIGALYTDYYPPRTIRPKKQNPSFSFKEHMQLWWDGNHRLHATLPPGTGTVLDIGCGEGNSLLHLQRLGYTAYGVDPDATLTPVVQAHGLQVHIGTIDNAPYAPGSFDIILANQLMEHIADPHAFLARCRELLTAQGTLLLSTPNANSIYRTLMQRRWINWHVPYHQIFFTKHGVRTLAEQHGLRVEALRTVSPTSWALHQIQRIRHEPTPGIRNAYWYPEKSASGATEETAAEGTPRPLLKRTLYHSALSTIRLGNRLIDKLGLGDCLLIALRKP